MSLRTNTKMPSSLHEHTIAKYLGWRVVTGSGSRPTYTGDIIDDDYLGECKTHIRPQTKVEFLDDVWIKIRSEAEAKHKLPALFSDDGHQMASTTFVMIPVFAVPDDVTVDEVVIKPTSAGNIILDVDKAEQDLVHLSYDSQPSICIGAYRTQIAKQQVYILRCTDFKKMLEV